MKNKEMTVIKKNVESGYKVIKVEVAAPTESLYAVCTPVNKQ